MQAVERLVGVEHAAAFVTAATERELQARTLDRLAANSPHHIIVDEVP
jgi:anti-anti-sigma regulatory factor